MTKPTIDISYWQSPNLINYDTLAGQIDGVILRACYGTSKDTAFDRHYAEFVSRGVKVGAYHYIIGNAGIQGQATAFRNATLGKTLDLGLWIDVEDIREGTKLSRKNVLDYAALIPEAGIYTSKSRWQEIMGGTYLNDRKLWVAHYTTGSTPLMPTGWSDYHFWQYSSTGRLAGYNSNLDMNRASTPPPDPDPIPPVVETPLYEAVVSTVPPNRLRVRRTPNGELVRWLASGDTVSVFQEQVGWSRIGVGEWSSADWLQKLINRTDLMDVPLYSQRDPRWANDKMGSSGITLGAQGCLATITSAGLTILGYPITPKEYNLAASTKGGYQAPNLMYWKFPDVLTKNVIVRDEYQSFNSGKGWETLADRILSDARPVWAQVDFIPGGTMDQHWVLILGKSEGNYWCLDPYYGTISALAARYNGVFRVVSYRRQS